MHCIKNRLGCNKLIFNVGYMSLKDNTSASFNINLIKFHRIYCTLLEWIYYHYHENNKSTRNKCIYNTKKINFRDNINFWPTQVQDIHFVIKRESEGINFFTSFECFAPFNDLKFGNIFAYLHWKNYNKNEWIQRQTTCCVFSL